MKEEEKTLEKKMISPEGYDLCVVCSEKTRYKTDIRIDMRYNYVEGAGQLCDDCANKIYSIKK